MTRLHPATRRPGCIHRVVGPFLLGMCLALPSLASGDLRIELASKLEPSLLNAALHAPEETLSVWLALGDKGERDPAHLAALLADAEAALSPRARARRVRAHVHPLVDYRDLPVHAPYVGALAGRGLQPVGVSRWFNQVAVRVPGARLAELAELPFVHRIAPVERMFRSSDPVHEATPSGGQRNVGPTFSATVAYGQTLVPMTQMNLPAVHDSGYIGTGVLVCVLDEGFNFFDRHEALRDQVIPLERQRDFVRGVNSVQDTTNLVSFGHGTSVLGCLAGKLFGTYVGAAYGAEFALARTEVHTTETPQEMVNWGLGAEWADSLGADIISSSLGYFTFDNASDSYTPADMDGHTTIVSRAAEIATSKGILVVTAVGNEGGTAWHYLIAPSDVDGAIAVGAVDAAGTPAFFSSYGPSADGRVKPDVAARGVSTPTVLSSSNPSGYVLQSGTSFATPLVAGVAACLMQAHPQWAPRDVLCALSTTASRADSPNDRVGYGIVNALAALQASTGTGAGPAQGRVSVELLGSNPARPDQNPVRLRVTVPGASSARVPGRVRVLDSQGRRVRELWAGVLTCGIPATVSWDGRDERGRVGPAGLYFITLEAGGARVSVRLVSLR